MLRNILAVIAGYLITGLLIVSTDHLLGALVPAFNTPASRPPSYFLVSVVYDTLYSLVGGFLCSRIAHASSRRNATLGLIIFGEAVGVASTFFLWNTVPHWWSFALLLLYPPAVWLGHKLQSRQSHVAPA